MTFRPLAVAAALALAAGTVFAQQKEIKIGFIYDVSGPFAGGGSEPAQVGTKAIVDYFNERGGVAGYNWGKNVARKKEQYAKTEDYLDACIGDARACTRAAEQENAALRKEVVRLNQRSQQLKSDYRQRRAALRHRPAPRISRPVSRACRPDARLRATRHRNR